MEIIKHDHKLHSTGHKFTLMELLDYILIFFNIKCETTRNLTGTILLRYGYTLRTTCSCVSDIAAHVTAWWEASAQTQRVKLWNEG
jgi:hypothetical protein